MLPSTLRRFVSACGCVKIVCVSRWCYNSRLIAFWIHVCDSRVHVSVCADAIEQTDRMIFVYTHRLTTIVIHAHHTKCATMWKIGKFNGREKNQLTHNSTSAQQTNRNVCIGEAFVTNWLCAYKIVGCKGIVFCVWQRKILCDSISERWSIRFPHFGSPCSVHDCRWKVCSKVHMDGSTRDNAAVAVAAAAAESVTRCYATLWCYAVLFGLCAVQRQQ